MGLAALDEALKWPEVTEEYSFLPELHRIRGELLRLSGREEEARGEFLESIRYAREHDMLAYERRATASLRRQSQELGLHEEAPLHP